MPLHVLSPFDGGVYLKDPLVLRASHEVVAADFLSNYHYVSVTVKCVESMVNNTYPAHLDTDIR